MANLTQLHLLEGLSGFLLIDKPTGLSFSTIVKTVKRKFNLTKVGHGGSLETAASGLLILLINDANRYCNDIMGMDRSYSGEMTLGITTNTHDIQGAVTATQPVAESLDFTAALAACSGDIFQTESRWSAIRKEQSAFYEVVDTGEHKVQMAHVYSLKLGEPGAVTAEGTRVLPFTLRATKGLIVRTLVNDFGLELGCGAALSALRRLRMGRFSIDEALSFDQILAAEQADLPALVQPMARMMA